MSELSVPTFRITESPSTKHFPSSWWPDTVFRLPNSLPAEANRNWSSSALFLHVSSSIYSKAFCSFSSSNLSLSDLHHSQIHLPISATWALTFPQLLGNQCPQVSHCIPDFRLRSHPLHKTCVIFHSSTAGPEFCSTPPFTNNVANTAAHRSVVPMSRLNPPLLTRPCRTRHDNPRTHASSVFLQVTTHTQGLSHNTSSHYDPPE